MPRAADDEQAFGSFSPDRASANVPHQFTNKTEQPVRLLCICAPSGQDKFFMAVGVPVATRTTPPQKLDEAAQEVFMKKAEALAPKYKTELLQHA